MSQTKQTIDLKLCSCKEKLAKDCPGEWEIGCDLDNNEKYAKPAESNGFLPPLVELGKLGFRSIKINWPKLP